MNVVHLSPEWTALTGLDVASSMGRGWLAAIHPDDRAAVRDTLRLAAHERCGFCVDYRLLDRHGTGLWVTEAAVASFAPGERNFLGALGCIVEITTGPRPVAARGTVGAIHPVPLRATALSPETHDLLAGHLLRARAMAEAEGDRGLMEALDVALYLARRRFDRIAH